MQTSQEVQNRGISGLTNLTYVLQFVGICIILQFLSTSFAIIHSLDISIIDVLDLHIYMIKQHSVSLGRDYARLKSAVLHVSTNSWKISALR